MRRNLIWMVILGCGWACEAWGQPLCIAYIRETQWINGDVSVESDDVNGRTYQWSTSSIGCSVSSFGYRAVVHRPPGGGGQVSLTVTQAGCTDSHTQILTTNNMPYLPLIGDSVVCGSNPVLYECIWYEGPGGPSYYNHNLIVTGGVIVRQTQTSLPNYRWHERTWISWRGAPTGNIRSYYSNVGFPIGTFWEETVQVNCWLTGSDYACAGAPSGFGMHCPPGSTYTWSTAHGTVVQGQSTDSVQILWPSTGVDTVVTIFSSPTCGLDTNYFPVTIIDFPTNQISGDTVACENTLDTFYTSVLPVLNPPSVTKIWHVTGGGLNINSSPRDVAPYVHGPGPVETIALTTDDHGCVFKDTFTVNILPAPVIMLPPNPVICTGDSLLLNAGPGFATYAWSTGASASAIFANAAIPYTISVTDVVNNCLGTTTVTPTIEPDCVWPGDANHDYIVDANDFLDIGVAFGDTGPLRANATTNWSGQPAANWSNAFFSGQNYKHADCDGDGVVDFPDTMSVSLYQGLTHARIGHIAGGVPLRIRPSMPQFAGQDSLELIVELGEPGFPADSVYGLAIHLDFAPSDVFPGVAGKVSPSFLGTLGNGLMAMGHGDHTAGRYDFAMVRTDHVPYSGFGEVCRIRLKALPALWTAHTKVQLPIQLSRCRLVDAKGHEITVTPVADTVWLYDLGYVSAPAPASELAWSLSPNPATDVVHLQLDSKACGLYALSLVDMRGKVVASQAGRLTGCGTLHALDMDVRDLADGVYGLRLAAGGYIVHGRVVVLR
jgi:hypothetical protein